MADRQDRTAHCVLGLDPGLLVTGYGVVQWHNDGAAPTVLDAGVIKAHASGDLASRLAVLYGGLRDVMAEYQPDAVALEELYTHYDRPRTAILMGHARGVLCLAAHVAGRPLFHYSATAVKKAVSGSGRAPKSQIQWAVARHLHLALPPEPADVADALAVALCHCFLSSRTDPASGLSSAAARRRKRTARKTG